MSEEKSEFTGLILVSGIDTPGITQALFDSLAPFAITVLDIEQVDQLGAPRRVGHAGQLPLVGERVDQRRLADVGAPGEGHFRQVGIGQPLHLHRAHHEFGAAREQDAGLLIGLVGEEGFGRGAHPAAFGLALPVSLPMMLSIGLSTLKQIGRAHV